MAMKETERSLRLYFMFVGAISLLYGLSEVGQLSDLKGLSLPFSWTLAIYVPLCAHICLGAGFLVSGIKLKTALLTGADLVKKLLIASAVALFVDGALVASVLGIDLATAELGRAIVGLAITVYLYRSVVRLSQEAKDRAGIPPAPPEARVVS